jgi:hypothetical protein
MRKFGTDPLEGPRQSFSHAHKAFGRGESETTSGFAVPIMWRKNATCTNVKAYGVVPAL